MYGCETWIRKKAKCWRIDAFDAFELWCWRKTLESPFDCKEIKPINPKGNQPWIFIGRTDTKQKLQYFGHLMWRTDSLEKTVMLGKTEGKRRRRWQRMRWLDSVTDSMDMNLSKFQEMEGDRGGSFATVMSLQRWTQLATEELQHMKHSYLYEKRFYVVETYTWKRDNIVEK